MVISFQVSSGSFKDEEEDEELTLTYSVSWQSCSIKHAQHQTCSSRPKQFTKEFSVHYRRRTCERRALRKTSGRSTDRIRDEESSLKRLSE